jgi:Tfp pilus assembly protein PilE
MGQQQLLLIILGVIVVGIAVAVGITMFTDNAQSANRDAVGNDLVNFASRAQQYYRRPTALGGGGNSFTNLTMKHLSSRADASGNVRNSNGTYQLVGTPTASAAFYIKGTGTENGTTNPSLPLVVMMQVWPDSAKVDLTHADAN